MFCPPLVFEDNSTEILEACWACNMVILRRPSTIATSLIISERRSWHVEMEWERKLGKRTLQLMSQPLGRSTHKAEILFLYGS